MSFAQSRSANVWATSASLSFCTNFVDIYQKDLNQNLAVKSDKLGIFHGAKFENCYFNVQVMNVFVTRRRPQKLKPLTSSDSLKKASS